jgi:ABC-type transporter Mla MlaB component
MIANMQKTVAICFQQNEVFISGDINFSNAGKLYSESLPLLEQATDWHFNFSQLKSSNSVLLALIIEWIKLAKHSKKKIQFSALSADIHSIAKTAGLEQLIACTF